MSIISMKNSNDTIGNRTLDLSICSAVPQPTALPRAPVIQGENEMLGRIFGTKIGGLMTEKWGKYEDLNSL
jgi:hypothetical protein